MKPMFKRDKADVALLSQALNGAATGSYFNMARYRKALFWWQTGAMAAGVTSTAQVMQATDAAGAGAKPLAEAVAVINANDRVVAALLTNAAVHVAGDVYIVNGLAFTAAAADVPGTRTYAVGANAAASAANLAAKINDPVIGVPGVVATVDGAATITLTASEPGEVDVTLTASAGAVGVPSTVSAIGHVEIDASELDKDNGFDFVALQITNTAAAQTAAFVLRGDGRFEPDQIGVGN